MTSLIIAATLLGCTAYASIAQFCPETDICYNLNIPDSTASSGYGDIYFQISASTAYSWVALGQGSGMSGSNIFVVYTSSDGQNVTVSPRLGTGHVMPEHDNTAQVTVLEGSGVSDGRMTANVLCRNCNSWSGGSMEFTGSSSDWIHAYKSGNPLNTDDVAATIQQHDDASAFTWSLTQAKGGNDTNPFVNGNVATESTTSSPGAMKTCSPSQILAQPSGSGCPTSWPSEYSTSWPTARPTWASSCLPSGYGSSAASSGHVWPTNAPWQNGNGNSKRQTPDSCGDGNATTSSGGSSDGSAASSSSLLNNGATYGRLSPEQSSRMLTAHGALAALAFVGFFPIGGILVRLASFTGLSWVHAALQVLASLIYIAAFGLGIFMATHLSLTTNAHPVIGIVLFILLVFQPAFGLLHHRLFQKYEHRTLWSYLHLGTGRLAILLGMINGGLGLQLADASRAAKVVYAVVAGVVALVYIAAIMFGELSGRREARPPSYDRSQGSHSIMEIGASGENIRDVPLPPKHDDPGRTRQPYQGT